ncbi:hypothetical protein AAT19DRAFT_12701 [Rhodotorula toruloides]|uniref:Uncharacterized protein n=1 Tax=Rhodotorula toruloides TaxID=5286 RepID=A0A2T0AH00_RHOTO|nr:hypothetical protein AAT19DRAFT_12701 [Rhodotorula toruloides]
MGCRRGEEQSCRDDGIDSTGAGSEAGEGELAIVGGGRVLVDGQYFPSLRQIPVRFLHAPAPRSTLLTTARTPNHPAALSAIHRKAFPLDPRSRPPRHLIRSFEFANTIEMPPSQMRRKRAAPGLLTARESKGQPECSVRAGDGRPVPARPPLQPSPLEFRTPPALHPTRPVPPEPPQERVSRSLSLPDEVCARIARCSLAPAPAPRRCGWAVLANVQIVLCVQSETHKEVRGCVGWCAAEQPWLSRRTTTRLSPAHTLAGSLRRRVLQNEATHADTRLSGTPAGWDAFFRPAHSPRRRTTSLHCSRTMRTAEDCMELSGMLLASIGRTSEAPAAVGDSPVVLERLRVPHSRRYSRARLRAV